MMVVHYTFEDMGITPLNVPDCKSVYVVQDAYTRQFYPDTHEKYLAVATQEFPSDIDAFSYSRNHGVIDTLTATVALAYDPDDCTSSERKQFDSLVGKEVSRMLLRGDR